MSASRTRGQNSPKRGEHLAPGEKNLNYNNVGLFSDPYLDQLPKIESDSFVLERWDTEGLPAFNETYEFMLSTWEEMKDVFQTQNESQLEDQWIRKIFAKMGWHYEVQTRIKKWGKTEIPDYSLFESREAFHKAKKAKTEDKYFECVSAVADAKAMNVPLDGSKKDKTNPSYQIVWYMQLTGKEWGILTDGRYWRLYSTKSKSRFSTYYEVNVERFLGARDDEGFKYFYNFFSKAAFEKGRSSSQSFLDVVFDSGERYAKEVETKLRDRAYSLVELLAQGFSAKYEKLDETQLKNIYEHSLYFLFRLLFILNCEAKGLLNISRTSSYYVQSLRFLCSNLKEQYEAGTTWGSHPRSFNLLKDLFKLLESGDSRIGLHGFGNEVFASGDPKFFESHPISDFCLNKVLVDLAFSEDPKEKHLKFVDYKRLSPDHIGSIFEGLLEFRLKQTSKGLRLENDNGERKSTGSYYTPDHVVDYIIHATLAPIVAEKSAAEILNIKLIDSAMGSGHFILGAIKFLETSILEKISKGDVSLDIEPSEIRWKILHSCIYGCDMNPLSVELAKFSLWIFTARADFEVEPLADQLVCRNSLADKAIHAEYLKLDKKVSWRPLDLKADFPEVKKWDAIVGNPPWGGKLDEESIRIYSNAYPASNYKLLDTFKFFTEKSMSILGPGGRLGYLIPSSFLTHIGCRDTRELLLTGGLDQVVDLGDGVFSGVCAPCCVIIATKGHDSKNFKLVQRAQGAKLADDPNPKLISVSRQACLKHTNFEISTPSLSDELRDTHGFKKLSELADVFDSGIDYSRKELGDRVFYDSEKAKSAKDFKVLRGSNINRFFLKHETKYLRSDWKKIETSLKVSDPKTRLKVNEKAYTDKLKILVRQTANEIIGAIDLSQHYNQKSLLSIHPKQDVDPYFLLGILNSNFLTKLYRELVDESSQAFAQVKKNKLEQLPIPSGRNIKVENEISEISKTLSKQNLKGAISTQKFERLNSLVEQLYET